MSGNGADLAAIYQAILAISADLQAVKADVRALDKKVDRGFAELRAEITAYHGSVVGHGVLISELEERVGRLERGEPTKAA